MKCPPLVGGSDVPLTPMPGLCFEAGSSTVLKVIHLIVWIYTLLYKGISFPYRWAFNSAVQYMNSIEHCLDPVIMYSRNIRARDTDTIVQQKCKAANVLLLVKEADSQMFS